MNHPRQLWAISKVSRTRKISNNGRMLIIDLPKGSRKVKLTGEGKTQEVSP